MPSCLKSSTSGHHALESSFKPLSLHIREMAGQDSLGTQNHSQDPGPTLMFNAEKLLFSWWPVVLHPGTFMYSWTVFTPRTLCPMWFNMFFSAQFTLRKSGSLLISLICSAQWSGLERSRLVAKLIKSFFIEALVGTLALIKTDLALTKERAWYLA